MRLAVENVYRILQIYEVYEYQVTQHNPHTGEVEIFVDYLNPFLKLKANAIGYTGWVRSPEDEEQYVESFWKSEGIGLIRYKAAKRGSPKICLNSIWRKLMERNDRTMTRVIKKDKNGADFWPRPEWR